MVMVMGSGFIGFRVKVMVILMAMGLLSWDMVSPGCIADARYDDRDGNGSEDRMERWGGGGEGGEIANRMGEACCLASQAACLSCTCAVSTSQKSYMHYQATLQGAHHP